MGGLEMASRPLLPLLVRLGPALEVAANFSPPPVGGRQAVPVLLALGYAGVLRRLRSAARNSDQEATFGYCLSNTRRWRSVMPPQTPNSIWLSSASARHSATTGQCRQIAAAFLCAAPRTKSSSGSVERHRAFDTHAIRPSAILPMWAAASMLDTPSRGVRPPAMTIPARFRGVCPPTSRSAG